MKRITVFITLLQFRRLTALATQQGRPFAEVLRRAIDVFLAQYDT